MVNAHYEGLFRFALSLTQRDAEACDLTQQTFYVWAAKGHQLRDRSKVKSWLFTTLHREFLGSRRRETRFPHHEMESVESELPVISPASVNELDAAAVLEALGRVDEVYRAPLMLFFLEDHSYREIAEVLGIPVGTVMSRLSRGKAQLKGFLSDRRRAADTKIIKVLQPSTRAGER